MCFAVTLTKFKLYHNNSLTKQLKYFKIQSLYKKPNMFNIGEPYHQPHSFNIPWRYQPQLLWVGVILRGRGVERYYQLIDMEEERGGVFPLPLESAVRSQPQPPRVRLVGVICWCSLDIILYFGPVFTLSRELNIDRTYIYKK